MIDFMPKYPFVSVVIPTKNSGRTLAECLDSLKKQDYLKSKYEIIIVDDNSRDDTVKIAKNYGAKVLGSKGPPGRQRNKGISAAKGEIIGLIDSDCVAERSWIRRGVKHFISKKVAIVGGPNFTHEDDPFISHCSGYVYSSKVGSGAMSARYVRDGSVPKESDETGLISCNMFLRRDVIRKRGGFTEEFFPNEENELMFRVKRAGYKLLYVPSITVWHHRRSSIKGFFLQAINYGKSRARFVRKHRSALKPIHLLPSVFVLGLLFGPVISSFFLPFKIIFLVSIIIYISLIGSSGLNASVKKRDTRLFFIMPLLFFLLHIAYGIGFLKGLVRKS